MFDLIDAAKTGDLAAIRRILAEDPAAVSARAASGETPLMTALYRGHTAVVRELLDAGAPLDLFAAAATGRIEALEAALAREDVNGHAYDGWTALHLAAFFGHAEAAASLLDHGASPNATGRNSLRNTPLHAATAGRHSDVALLLIERGADVRAGDAGGHTPLHIAAENGLLEVVRALLAAGADPHAVDADQMTPLSRAAAKNQEAVVDLINDPS